jgi:hypothetical protein
MQITETFKNTLYTPIASPFLTLTDKDVGGEKEKPPKEDADPQALGESDSQKGEASGQKPATWAFGFCLGLLGLEGVEVVGWHLASGYDTIGWLRIGGTPSVSWLEPRGENHMVPHLLVVRVSDDANMSLP